VSNDLVVQLSDLTNKMLGEPQASLLNGILFGSQVKLPKDLTAALRETGTLHIVAVSGQNMSILAGFLGKALGFLGSKLALVFQAGAIIGYIWLVGGGASVVRSGIMALIALVALATGRQADSGRALVVAAVGMVLIHSDYLTDVGWQLSVLATAGIIWLEPLISKPLSRFPEILVAPLAVSLAAEIFTWPIIVFNFGIFSLVSIPTNILIDWTIPWIMALGAVSLVAGSVWFEVGQALAYLAWVPLTYFVEVVGVMSNIPSASINVASFSLGLMVFYYSLISGFIILCLKRVRLS